MGLFVSEPARMPSVLSVLAIHEVLCFSGFPSAVARSSLKDTGLAA